MSSGWIKLHRSICDNALWFSEPFNKAHAWVDLILIANHARTILYKRGIKVTVNRGEVAWSEAKLAERWGWSRGKVRRYLKELETVQQIVHHKNHTLSRIIIINYEKYQVSSTTDGTTDSTNNNKGKNDKNTSEQSSQNDMGWTNKRSDDDADLPEVDLETGEVKKEVKAVSQPVTKVYTLFKDILGIHQANWMINKTQRLAASNLLTEHTEDQIKNALKLYTENKDKEYCPVIQSPYDLDSKWEKLKAFKKKNSL